MDGVSLPDGMGEKMAGVLPVQKLFDLTHTAYSFGERKMHTRAQYRYPKEPPNGDKSKIYAYLGLRRISQKTADYLDIRQDERGNFAFLYCDANDTLTMVKYRPAHKVKKGENKNWCQPGADTLPLLYNMNRVNADAPLIICTGEPDAASCIEAGCPNAVSIPFGDGNTHWIEECWEWLEQFREIILCHDNDESGRKYCKEVVPRLGSWRCRIASIPETYEDENGTRPIKDLNECLYWYGKEKVLEIIASAKESPVDSVFAGQRHLTEYIYNDETHWKVDARTRTRTGSTSIRIHSPTACPR